jgi:hypothetical protein
MTTAQPVAVLVREVLRLGTERGVRFVLARHVPEDLMNALAQATHDHALSHAQTSEDPTWLAFPGGILRWWQEEGGLDDEEARRLHKFRSDLVDWLEERGMALREDPRASTLLVRPAGGRPSNPDWTRDEDVVALDLHVRAGSLNGGPLLGKTDERVIALSHQLRSLPIHPSEVRTEGFRNRAGVALKFANFRATERVVKIARGDAGAEALPAGMSSYSAMDLAVFEEYLDRDFVGLEQDAKAILATAAAFDDAVKEPVVEDQPLEKNDIASYTARGVEGGTRSRAEQALVLKYAAWMESQGIAVRARWYRVPGVARPLRADAFVTVHNLLIEAKGSDARGAVRMAVGQLLDYRRLEKSAPVMAVLLPYEPTADVRDYLTAVGVDWIWPRRSKPGFRDSAGGKYT